LSAALSESGLGGDFFDFSDPASAGDVPSGSSQPNPTLYPAATQLQGVCCLLLSSFDLTLDLLKRVIL
jgi:hypothetical protein